MSHRTYRCALIGCVVALLAGCASKPPSPDFGAIYDTAAAGIGASRTPVVVIPGILGSKLVDGQTGKKVWGSFTFGAADADTPEGARMLALPMRPGAPLRELRDEVWATDVLDVVVADVAIFRGLEIGAYIDIMKTLAAGRYRDQSLGESGAVDYGGAHYTCFQLPYDWRRSVSEAAAALDGIIEDAKLTARHELGLADDAPIKVDVVAHSMGGMVLRYYLRYGNQPLPADGSPPELTWAGATSVRRAVLVGTPSGGSVLSLEQLIKGMNLNPIFPNYRPVVLGTMPAVFELLPRARAGAVVDARTGEPIDVFDIETWKRYNWGLADPKSDRYLAWLMPDIDTPEARREAALDHLQKILTQTKQLHRAIDRPASPPDGLEIFLFAGDARPTPSQISVDARGKIKISQTSAGDNTVTRTSALMDERTPDDWTPGLRSPIEWGRVQFLFSDHLGLTKDPAFVDSLLYLLLEDPPLLNVMPEQTEDQP